MTPPAIITQNAHAAIQVETFDPVQSSWSRWVERLEMAFDIFDCEDNKKVSMILHYMGQRTYNILCDKISPAKASALTYAQIVAKLSEHFDPEPLEIVENYRFHLRKQEEGESAEDFLIALRKLSIRCKFGTYLDTALRNQLVFGLRSQRIQNRLLEVKNLTLETAISTAVTMELSERGGVEMQHQKAVNSIKSKSPKTNKKKNVSKNEKKIRENSQCYRCGSDTHLANTCRYKNTECLYCKKKGHLKRVCLKAKANKVDQTNQIDHVVDEVCNIGCTFNVDSKIFTNILVNNINVKFEVDTGSSVTLVNLRWAQNNLGKLTIHASDRELISYCGNKLKVYGFVNVEGRVGSQKKMLKLYVVDSQRHPLLGRDWLSVFKLNWRKIFEAYNQETSSDSETLHISAKVAVGDLVQKYKQVFEKTVGKIKGLKARIRVKEGTIPVFLKPRRAPFALKTAIENEIEELVASGILEKVDSSEWATPIVAIKKSENRVRICGDYKVTVNPNLIVDEHPLPTIDEMFASMAGGKKFTKLDLTKAYLQMEVHEDDRSVLTLNTHKGLYTPTRLWYGIASGPARWQREIEKLLQGIEGVTVFIDDIKITASNDEMHLQRLEAVLKRLQEHNMRVNYDKCEFMADKIEYCGYIIDSKGIHKMQQKIDAIQNMRRPHNIDEVRALVGLVNYYGRFLRNLSTILYPINNLLRKDVQFVWDKKCENSFLEIKNQIGSDVVLTHYDPTLPLVLATDASPYGVGAVLSHTYPDGTEKPIQYASQTLSPVQQRYSQIDREAYAIIFGIKKFYQYVYGRKFTLLTDNKPLSQIFSPQKGLPTLTASRMQHYAIFLESFNFNIQYRKASDNANVDAMSRLPSLQTYKEIEEVDVIEINSIETLPLTVKELAAATELDTEVSKLIQALQQGSTVEPHVRFGIEQTEFSLQQNCLLRGSRVYVPKKLRKKVLSELHTAHFGMTKMKELARGYCWWKGMDAEIEEMVKNCEKCQMYRPSPTKVVHCWEPAEAPFDRVHIDFAGPFKGSYFLVMVDSFSKWPEIRVVPNITTDTTIKVCREIFSCFGVPRVLVSDHGTQFTSREFQNFLKQNGVVQKKGAPYHPATNGQAERYIRTLKEKLKSLNGDKQNLKKELCKVLHAYRRAKHSTTGKSPSELVFGRQIRSRLDLMIPEEKQVSKKAGEPKFKVGERVAARDYLSDTKWKFGKITEVLGAVHFMVLLDDGRLWKRHVNQLRSVGSEIVNLDRPHHTLVDDGKLDDATQNKEIGTEVGEDPEVGNAPLRRSNRVRQAPTRLEYHTFK